MKKNTKSIGTYLLNLRIGKESQNYNKSRTNNDILINTNREKNTINKGRQHPGNKYLLRDNNELISLIHHQMVNTKIRLIIFFAAKHGEAL